MFKMKMFLSVFFVALLLHSHLALAAPEVRFGNVTWTGVTVKTELGVNILKSLGYEAKKSNLAVPIVYKGLEMGDLDVFLGNWMPSMASIAKPFFENGSIVQYVANMPGAKYTLAAPAYVVDGGLKDFSDIAKFADQLDHKIYGIEPGNDGNQIIQAMIDQNQFGLGDFELVATSEPIMLSEVKSFAQQKKWIVFLGWAPHYMNQMIDMKYLTGSTGETFGENNGTATVYTNIRKGFAEDQPNVAKFLKQFTFPISMMNEISQMLNNNETLDHAEAGLKWIEQHPEIYRRWLEGVTTVDGQAALPAFEAYLQGM
jgi:glycine betaine/proline transport system substrate-binding protein